MTTQPDLSADVDDLRRRADDAQCDAEDLEDDVEGVHAEVIAQGKQIAELHKRTVEMAAGLSEVAKLYADIIDAFELTLAEIASGEGSRMAARKLIEWKTAQMKAARKAVTP